MISVEHLTKCYGDFVAVKDLSFEIEEGHVYGFLGPNGAGKSTTMNIMTGCLSPTDGRVKIGEYDILEEPEKAKRLLGYLPEQPPLYMNETPEEYLKFVGEAKGLRGSELREQVEEVIEQTRLQDVRGRLIGKLSKGYKQRVGIAQALLGNPKVIILDEPTVGLDPLQIIEIRDLIKQLGQNHTVILSSHILSEVQAICEKILIISQGKLVAYDDTENLEKLLLSTNEITLVTEADEKITGDIVENLEYITDWSMEEIKDGLWNVQIKVDTEDVHSVCRLLFFAFSVHEKAILEMQVKKASLEEVFIELTENESSCEEEAMREVENLSEDEKTSEEETMNEEETE